MTAIKTENLTKKYKDKTVVNKLNLEINKGELFALLGVNGAGKSTTIKMLTTLVTPTRGDAILFGNSIVSDRQAVKEITSVSPQETAVAQNLTVKENLQLMAKIYGFKGSQVDEKVSEIMEKFDLEEIAKSKAKTLSGGWQRRLSIAMALISEPKILFLDEPTLGIDVLARRELWEQIEKLKGNTTIILTTHYLEEAESLSDRIGIMNKGVLKAVGTATELIQLARTEDFEQAFVKLSKEAV